MLNEFDAMIGVTMTSVKGDQYDDELIFVALQKAMSRFVLLVKAMAITVKA